jgi:hypothetical protein
VPALDYNEYKRNKRVQNSVDIRAFKLLRGCADCGYNTNPDALQFDHLPGEKRYTNTRGLHTNVSSFASNDSNLRKEIAKCEVVCANCHAIRTAERRRSLDATA